MTCAETERVMPCAECGGDGGFDVPHDIDRRDGGLITHWQECRACSGTGDYIAVLSPVMLEDLDHV